jgi:hypothetical protein
MAVTSTGSRRIKRRPSFCAPLALYVRETLMPLVADDTRTWLAALTAPLGRG